MERFTISLAEELAREFDALIAERGYENRSEAVRDLIRRALGAQRRHRQPYAHCREHGQGEPHLHLKPRR